MTGNVTHLNLSSMFCIVLYGTVSSSVLHPEILQFLLVLGELVGEDVDIVAYLHIRLL